MRRVASLAGKFAFLLFGVVAAAGGLGAWITQRLSDALLGWLGAMVVLFFPVLWLASRAMRPITQLLRALSGTVASYREGDFSVSLVADRNDELGELMTAHNELGTALRTQRAHLVQRELLLDTVMQNSPVALLLVDAHDRIALPTLPRGICWSKAAACKACYSARPWLMHPRRCVRQRPIPSTAYSRPSWKA